MFLVDYLFLPQPQPVFEVLLLLLVEFSLLEADLLVFLFVINISPKKIIKDFVMPNFLRHNLIYAFLNKIQVALLLLWLKLYIYISALRDLNTPFS